jgi:HAD superfamily hydrolase (TIGR01509 family)
MFVAAILDMDGVIIDSEPFHYEVNVQLFHQLGITVAAGDYQSYIGVSHADMWSDLKRKHGLPQTVSALVEMQVKGNEDYLRNHSFAPIPGIEELLKQLRREGVRTGLASSSAMATIDLVLAKLGLRPFFGAVASGEEVPFGKPAPDIFLYTAAKLGIEPERCIVIEDSAHGVMAAKAAGMRCVGFQNPHSGDQDLGMADLVVARITDLTWETMRSII